MELLSNNIYNKLQPPAIGIANAALSQLSYIPNTVIIGFSSMIIKGKRTKVEYCGQKILRKTHSIKRRDNSTNNRQGD